eukprot:CAMPEP_0198590592 /NCGR_PEP_ID=MMETSP1462-20131121/135845_1 /TAXON_ID=1333877 /ORGANISM="Brandtodinium nutriculum, Strain RCC3387" /LENGTH=101 /DNA_ID=CAMNT_0044322127 /DNA_START=9 /DNA_END=311 /DNA_ORIENTATION=+
MAASTSDQLRTAAETAAGRRGAPSATEKEVGQSNDAVARARDGAEAAALADQVVGSGSPSLAGEDVADAAEAAGLAGGNGTAQQPGQQSSSGRLSDLVGVA